MTELIGVAVGDIQGLNERVVQLLPGKAMLMVRQNSMMVEISRFINGILFGTKSDDEVKTLT